MAGGVEMVRKIIRDRERNEQMENGWDRWTERETDREGQILKEH